ncbi:uncharacterized protein LOC141637220 [Silene latifolia]|uniref:uncharacterized protein LOC141637220 n=1 Tax=Silene latifolia TaxID=37657 RepID=UPI003D787FE6
MGNQEWMELYGDYVAHFHPEGMFDHCPCTVVDRDIEIGGRRSFKYFNMWGKADSFLSDVAAVWGRSYSGTKMFSLIKKLKALKPVLKGLNMSCFSDIENSTSIASALSESIQKQIVDEPGNFDLIQQEMELSAELKELISARDSFLTQKAKIQWSIEGDLNTCYFHQAIRKRIMMNKVLKIEDMHGKLFVLGDDIQKDFLSYYQDLLGTTTVTDHVSMSVLQVKKSSITFLVFLRANPQDPMALIANFIGMPGKLWERRLALVLHDIISRNQGAFVKGRSILENILICYDLMLEALNFPVKFRATVMTCISTTSYSLNLNGAHFGVLAYATDKWFFRYHPLCKSLKLTHLLFVDDLLMFCKGDVNSIMLLLRVVATFSATSGLRVNAAKSEVVFNGVAPGLKQDITEISGFTEGMLPFKYLGIPIQARRLTKTDCNVLIKKIVLRVRSIGARKLSYAGRLVLINSVFNTLHNYWASIFFIPKGVIKRIEAICRYYLWNGDTEYHRYPLVAWHNVCCSKKDGGLGIKEAGVWNVATVGKLVNWIYTKADRLWVLWIDHVYMKELIGIIIIVLKFPTEIGGIFVKYVGFFQVAFKDVWNGWTVPKQALIAWLVCRKALNTRVKLFQMGVTVDDNCVLCERGHETHCHLFTVCVYSKKILAGLENWLQRKLIVSSGECSKLQYQVIRLTRIMYWYTIWMERNDCRLELKLRCPAQVIRSIEMHVEGRVKQKLKAVVQSRDRQWLASIDILV